MLEHGRDAAGRGRHRARREVLALGVPRVLEVRVHVDRAGHHDESGGVDQLVRAPPAPGSASAAMRPPSITTSAAKTAESVATVPPAITVRFPLTATGSR